MLSSIFQGWCTDSILTESNTFWYVIVRGLGYGILSNSRTKRFTNFIPYRGFLIVYYSGRLFLNCNYIAPAGVCFLLLLLPQMDWAHFPLECGRLFLFPLWVWVKVRFGQSGDSGSRHILKLEVFALHNPDVLSLIVILLLGEPPRMNVCWGLWLFAFCWTNKMSVKVRRIPVMPWAAGLLEETCILQWSGKAVWFRIHSSHC